jgi:hypothetical protein
MSSAEEDMARLLALSLKLKAVRRGELLVTTYHFMISEVFTAVTMKNVVFWDIKTQFVLHRRHITSPLQSPAS